MRNFILVVFCIFTISLSGQVDYTHFPKVEIEQDLNYAFEKLTNIHPIFLDKEKLTVYKNNFSTAKQSLKDSMSQNEVYLLLAPLFASLNDGHTGVLVPKDQRSQYTKAGGKIFPFFVTIEKDSIYVSFYCGNDSTLFHGGEQILEINGITATKIIHDMQMLFGLESIANKQKTIADDFRFLIWVLYKFDKDYKFTVKNRQHKIREMTISGISNAEFMQNIKRMPKPNNELFSFSINEGNKTAVMKIKTFGDLDGFCVFADSAFAKIRNCRIENLVIDVRNNGGGRSIVVDSLMNYITGKEYSQYKKTEIRISPELKERYKEKYPDRYDWINGYPVDDLVISEFGLTKPQIKNQRFNGNLFLLTNNTSFSAAATFAGLFKELNLGTIIGEESGGTIAYYGDFWYLKTPKTGITFYVSPKHFTQYGGTDFNRGVIPDHLVVNKEDSIINFAYKLIEKKKQQNANILYK